MCARERYHSRTRTSETFKSEICDTARRRKNLLVWQICKCKPLGSFTVPLKTHGRALRPFNCHHDLRVKLTSLTLHCKIFTKPTKIKIPRLLRKTELSEGLKVTGEAFKTWNRKQRSLLALSDGLGFYRSMRFETDDWLTVDGLEDFYCWTTKWKRLKRKHFHVRQRFKIFEIPNTNLLLIK